MEEHRQLIGECEISYPHAGSVDGKGKETTYFYRDYEMKYFVDFELEKELAKKDGTLVYIGAARPETIAEFKRDGLKWKCVSSYE